MNENNCLSLIYIPTASFRDLSHLKGVIYRIVCLVNGKSYIGRTVSSFNARYRNKNRWFGYDHNTHFNNAKKKYGQLNFIVQILTSEKSSEELDLLEEYYISHYRTLNCKFGYNKLSGGFTNKLSEDCKNRLSIINRRSRNDFISKAASIHNGKFSYENVLYINGETKVSITCHLHGDFAQSPDNHLSGRGCRVCAYDRLSVVQRHLRLTRISPAIHKPVNQIDLVSNKIIRSFTSGSEAEKFLRSLGFKIARSTLTRTCQRNNNIRFGYKWELASTASDV